MRLDHPQLSPDVNRYSGVPGGLADLPRTPHHLVQPPADPEHPYRMTHTGLFTDVLHDESGAERPYAFYIPTTMKTSGNMVLVFLPSGEEPTAFFHASSWKESLERHCMTAYFLSAPKGWQQENPGLEVDAATRVLGEMRSMEYFPSNAPSVYCFGFGDGAAMATIFTVIHSSVFAAFAAWGSTEIDGELLDYLGRAPSDCDPYLTRSEIPMPAFLIGEPSNAGRYFKKAARVREEYLFNGFARVFRQQRRIGESCLNDTACCEVWLSEEKDAAILGRDVLIEKMVAFAEDYKRWGGEGNPDLRRTEHMDADPDMKRTDITVDGLKRFWYTYEPTAYKRGMKTKYPLVIAIHGFSCSAEFFAENSGWAKVAEERGCLVVFPNAYPFDDTLMGGGTRTMRDIAATPHWNAQGNPAENGPNEITFFRRLLEVVEEAYPIDTERVYVTGHSNGSMMTQLLMRHWPAPFAGFAPVGFMEARTGALPAPTDGIIRNPWYVMGEYDIHTSSLEGDNPNTRTLKMICETDHLDYAGARRFDCGIYENTIFSTADRVPLVRYTSVRNWPHTYTPELAFMVYDEWFSRYVRHENGELEYLG